MEECGIARGAAAAEGDNASRKHGGIAKQPQAHALMQQRNQQDKPADETGDARQSLYHVIASFLPGCSSLHTKSTRNLTATFRL